MVNKPTKPTKTEPNPMNRVLTDNKTPPKSRKQIYSENYQKNKERKKQQRKEKYQQDKEAEKVKQKQRYLKKKEQEQLTTKQQQTKYYGAEAIKILMTFGEYTELNKEKKKLWLDFNWTLQDCQKGIKEGLGSISSIMKLAQVADNLVRDYWKTAKSEQRNKSKSWNTLDYDEQQRIIKYWGYEKSRIENGYIDEAERLERQSQEYLKEIEMAKYHEERGKLKCECGWCEEQKKIQGEVKEKLEKDFDDWDQKSGVIDKEQCPECKKWVKELDEVSGVCKSCKQKYE